MAGKFWRNTAMRLRCSWTFDHCQRESDRGDIPCYCWSCQKKKKLFTSKGNYLRSGVYMYVFSPSPFSLFQMLSEQNFLSPLLEHSLLIFFYLFRRFLICALRLKQRKPYGAGWLLKEWEVCVTCVTLLSSTFGVNFSYIHVV